MTKHTFLMVIGCILPLLLIFLAPLLNLGADISLFIYMLFALACHILMPLHHNTHKPEENRHREASSSKKS